MPARTPAELLSDASLGPEEDAWTQPVELKGFGFLGSGCGFLGLGRFRLLNSKTR